MPTRRSGSPAGSRFPGLSSIGWGSGLTSIGAGASDTDTLDKTYQINEKLTWLKGRHTMKFGGQFLHYVQQRFYAGNNGLLGLFGYSAAFTGFAFSDFLLDQVASKGRGSLVGSHGRTSTTALRCSSRTTSRLTPALTLNLGMRWAYTQPVVEKDNRQSKFRPEHGPADPRAGRRPREPRALQGLHEGLRAAARLRLPRPSDRWVFRGGYGISQYMEGTGANLRLPLNPPFFFESAVQLRRDHRCRARWRPALRSCGRSTSLRARCAHGIRTCARSSPSSGTCSPSTCSRRSMSANVGYVGHNADHLVTPVEGNQPLPGVGDPSTWAAGATAPSAVRDRAAHHQHLDHRRTRPQRLQRAAGEPPPALHARARVPGVVHAGLGQDQQPRLLRVGWRGRRGRLLDEHLRAGVELRSGVLRRAAQPRVLGELRVAVRPRTHVWVERLVPSSTRSSVAGG